MSEVTKKSTTRAALDHGILAVILAAVAIFLLIHGSHVDYSTSDPLGMLLTAQSIIETGTIRLDMYASNVTKGYIPRPERLYPDIGQYRLINDHIYHYHPLGPVLLALPPVFLGWLSGHDMRDREEDASMQSLLSALTCSAAFILSFFLAKQALGFGLSFSLAVLFSLGTSFASTMGTALWSSNFAVLLLLGSAAYILRFHYRGIQPNPILFGLLLFGAYICRPPAIIFAVCVSVYMYRRMRSVLLKTIGTFTICFLFFMFFSIHEFGQIFPPYHSTHRLFESGCLFVVGSIVCILIIITIGVFRRSCFWGRWIFYPLFILLSSTGIFALGRILGFPVYMNTSLLANTAEAFWGNFFSPGRGLLIFSPFLFLILVMSIISFNSFQRNPLFRIATIWFLLHLVAISRPYRWHGGHCFGNRLSTEVLPAFLILSVLLVRRFPPSRWKYPDFTWLIIGVAVLVAVFNHSFQGLYNVNTAMWNTDPNVDEFPQYLFSWRYPQFFANPRMLEAKRDYHALFMEDVRRRDALQKRDSFLSEHPYAIFTSPIVPQRTDMIFSNWSTVHTGKFHHVYQTGRNGSSIWFYVPWDITVTDTLLLHLELAGRENLFIQANLNGQCGAPIKLRGCKKGSYSIKIPSNALNFGHANSLRFSLPALTDRKGSAMESAEVDTTFLFWSCRVKGLFRGTSREGAKDSLPLYRPSKKG